MADYIIVQNRETVLLGPMSWRQRMFQNEINELIDNGELTINYEVPPAEVGYVDLGDNVEIFPVEMLVTEYDPNFESLSGPFWTFDNNVATGSYTKQDGDIALIKGNLKNILASIRYTKEQTPFVTTVQNTEVTVDASRENRNIFVQKYQFMADNDTVEWKFPEGWLTLTKQELGSLVITGATFIQQQFDWEKGYADQIDAATTIAELKTILTEFNPPPVNPFDPLRPPVGFN
jgi:hypothetical protein